MSSILDITPVESYQTDLRPYFLTVMSNVTYDDILVKSTEHLMNKMDEYLLGGANTKKKLLGAEAQLSNFLKVISSKSYLSGKAYVSRATQKERDIVTQLGKKISDLILNIKCSQPDDEKEEKPLRERLNYNENERQNILEPQNGVKFNKKRIPNI